LTIGFLPGAGFMHAHVLDHPAPIDQQPLHWKEIPDPVLGPDEILLRISACAVCHTDLHIVEGEIHSPHLPAIPGHQVIGRVAAVGAGVEGWIPGDRAGIPWLYSACGECEYCKRGEENLCPQAEFTGLHRNGGFAEQILARADFAARIPDKFDDLHAAPLLCAGVIGYRSLRKTDLQPGETLGLFGFGASAHLAIQVARHWGCRVLVFTRSESHRRMAADLGADWTGGADDTPPVALDRAVIFAPAGELVPRALARLRPGGTLAINAIHMSNLPILPYSLLYGERTLRSVANATRADAREFLSLAGEMAIRVDAIPFPKDEANAALEQLKRGKIDGAAVLMMGNS
jgi:alcohol dehydrogenase, propanol-preferring